jgi:predicted CopG family antitoxin
LKSVKVHDDTHRALKRLKAKKRSRSIDQVIREMIRNSTG